MLHDVVQRKKFYTLVLQKCLTRSVRVEYDDEKISIKDIENAIDKLGYEVIKSQVKAL